MSRHRRSPCPVACALDLIGDRWTLLVVRDLACGKTLFKEFTASPEGIATNILSQRLRMLVAAGIAVKETGTEGYRLTAKGRSLLPILNAVAEWGLKHIPGTKVYLRPLEEAPLG